MNALFADTWYFNALVNPRDQWHDKAVSLEPLVAATALVTTENVLIEFLNYHAEYGKYFRAKVAQYARLLLLNLNVEVLPQRETTFLDALKLYESRLDKGYSLTDCISMNVMRERGIVEVLTHDHHFEQEGFVLLL